MLRDTPREDMAGIEEAIVAIMGTKEVVADTEEDMVGTKEGVADTEEDMVGTKESIVGIEDMVETKDGVTDTEEDMVGTEVAMVGTKEGMVVAIVGTNVFRVTIRLLFPRNQTYQTIIDSWSCQNGVV
jgi:hypothetical protein